MPILKCLRLDYLFCNFFVTQLPPSQRICINLKKQKCLFESELYFSILRQINFAYD